jgi:hypothetical protein
MFDTRTWIKVAGINQIYGPKLKIATFIELSLNIKSIKN